MSFIAMNRFKVLPGHEENFETLWKDRESRLKQMQGFQEFRLLKGPEGEGYRLYSSHALWATREDFDTWVNSEAFRESHKNAGKGTKGALMGPPQFEGFETVLLQG